MEHEVFNYFLIIWFTEHGWHGWYNYLYDNADDDFITEHEDTETRSFEKQKPKENTFL